MVSAPSSMTPCTVKPEDELWFVKSFSVAVVTVSPVGTFTLKPRQALVTGLPSTLIPLLVPMFIPAWSAWT
jgi:hypothetical protein